MDNRNIWQIRVDAIARFAMSRTITKALPLYVVTEYPKSGGSWVGQILSEYLEVPFPRNGYPLLKPSVQHAHYLYSPFLGNVLCVFRDGRDAVISYYFHMLFENDRSSPIVVGKTRRDLQFRDYDDVEANLPTFIEYLFETQARSASPFKFTWAEFVRSWSERNVAVVRYENMVADGLTEFSSALMALGQTTIDVPRLKQALEKYDFAKQAKRRPGEENKSSFLRKGIPGDWKIKFTRQAATVFDQLAGDELKALGYETDSSWVHNLNS